MSSVYKYQAWITQCQKIIDEARKQKTWRKRVGAALIINEIMRLKKKRAYKKKRFWVHPFFQLRHIHGFYEALFPTLSLYGDKFQNYLRVTTIQFEELLCLVGPLISKQNAIREPIPAAARLAMTLRYLATGDCMTSTSYQYLVGLTTVSNIIQETCKALWTCLSEEVLPYPLKMIDWLNIAQEFENQWHFNHCIGAIDGKHVVIQCPNAGSAYFNYKNSHSIVLLGICDANYLFTFIDIGAYGRRSDGGIFKDSLMGQKFNEKKMNLPKPEPLTVDGMPLPYVLVGDEAFQLTDYLLQPYPGKGGLNPDRNIFNFRISRARRTIENSFGILVCQWRI
ncbi:uncharacterized protein [Temnothorax longispinosus]|uniref:uncharacterized protein n=1 Tax=Temnothorax longispinosus TaxID=300112 RepID=UPI003A99E1B0